MKVNLKQRKPNKKGIITMYIEIYKGYTKDKEGKIKHHREYVKLKNCYLIAIPSNEKEENKNKEALAYAQAVKASLEVDSYNYKDFGLKPRSKSKTILLDYFWMQVESRKQKKGSYDNWLGAYKHLKKFISSPSLTFDKVDKKFVFEFKEFLMYEATTQAEKPLATNTQVAYFTKFKTCLNKAIEDGIIKENPSNSVKMIKAEDSKREYLTYEELNTLANTAFENKPLRDAFIFSCLTGLRWSDIFNLTWEQIKDEKEGSRIVFRQQKTKGLEYLDLSTQARILIGEQKEGKVFKGLVYSSYNNLALQRWVLKAKIPKKITFHCARHTFATLQIHYGTDIYTLSKLLGHTQLRTTEIYAKIIDQAKKEAVNRIPDINL